MPVYVLRLNDGSCLIGEANSEREAREERRKADLLKLRMKHESTTMRHVREPAPRRRTIDGDCRNPIGF